MYNLNLNTVQLFLLHNTITGDFYIQVLYFLFSE